MKEQEIHMAKQDSQIKDGFRWKSRTFGWRRHTDGKAGYSDERTGHTDGRDFQMEKDIQMEKQE